MEWHERFDATDPQHCGALGADLHLVVARAMEEDLRVAGIPSERIHRLPNACGLDPDRARRRAMLLSHRIDSKSPVLALGLHRRGGLDLALDVWATDESLPTLLLAGRDQGAIRTDRWQNRVDGDPRLRGRVQLIGPSWGEDREDLLDRAGCWLAPYPEDQDSRSHLCPLQVADALGSGLPLVTSDLPSIRQQWEDAGGPTSCRLVVPGDREALRRALHAALGPKNLPDPQAAAKFPRWTDRARVIHGLLVQNV
jgi:glycosyltransferase involved in cell wall biosynthesis